MPGVQEPHHVGEVEPAADPSVGTEQVGRHGLGPHVVGHRVVVRRLVRGESGPTGGPALTDLLGVCVAWTAGPGGECVVQLASGESVAVPLTDIVSGKPVPPRPSVRDRVSPRDAQVHGYALFADLLTEELGGPGSGSGSGGPGSGGWVLRHSPTSTARRAGSVLAFGPSGVALSDDEVVERVVAFYTDLGRRPVAAVLAGPAGSAEAAVFEDRGWVPESTDADTVFEVAAVSMVARALRGAGSPPVEVELTDVDGQAVARVLDAGAVLATGVASYGQDWVGFRSVEVAPTHRRRGLGLAVMAALLDWGAERGATTAYLQVLADNAPALALYERLGFREHHRYRYLAAP